MRKWIKIARRQASDGKREDDAARVLLEAGANPIEAIKALREVYSVDLAEAKQIVHRNLPANQQRSAEQLWDDIEAAFMEDP